jgi:hypothetical protein
MDAVDNDDSSAQGILCIILLIFAHNFKKKSIELNLGARKSKLNNCFESAGQVNKRPKKTKASKGSKFTMRIALGEDELEESIPPPLSQQDIMSKIHSLGNCCRRKKNCFLDIFSSEGGSKIDFNSAVDFFRECWEITRVKTKSEKETFLISEFKESLKPRRNEESDFDHVWRLKVSTVKNPSQTIWRHANCGLKLRVCRKVWYTVSGFTKWQVDKCSKVLRGNFEATTLSHHPFSDSTLHPYTYNETAEIFAANLPEIGEGKLISPISFSIFFFLISFCNTIYPDSSMIVSAC